MEGNIYSTLKVWCKLLSTIEKSLRMELPVNFRRKDGQIAFTSMENLLKGREIQACTGFYKQKVTNSPKRIR